MNNQLGLDDAAKGILNHIAKHHGDIKVVPSWQEKLGRWDEALELYQQQTSELDANMTFGRSESTAPSMTMVSEEEEEEDKGEESESENAMKHALFESKLGEMRCLSALDDHEKVSKAAKKLLGEIHELQQFEIGEANSNNSVEDKKGVEAASNTINEMYTTWISDIETLGAKASWVLGDWKNLEHYMSSGRVNSSESR